MVRSVLCCTLSFLLMQSQNTLSFNFIDLPSRYTNRRKGARVIQMKHHWNTCIFGRGGGGVGYTDCVEGLSGRSYIWYDPNNMEGGWDVWEVLLGNLSWFMLHFTCLRLSWLCSPTRAFGPASLPTPHRPILGRNSGHPSRLIQRGEGRLDPGKTM